MTRRLTLVAALALPLFCAQVAAASPATAAGVTAGRRAGTLTDVNINARFTGRLVVRFRGDAGAGCAVHGLCGYSGTIIWTPSPSAEVDISSVYVVGPRLTQLIDILDGENDESGDGGVTNTITQDSLPALTGMSTAGPACVDATYAGGDIQGTFHGARVQFELAQVSSPSLIQTRCAGPMIGDVASALPKPEVSFAAIRHGDMTIGLGGRHRFDSHGFAGTVDSTLSARLAKPRRPQRQQNGATFGPGERYRSVALRYRTSLSGAVVTTVDGDANPALCGPLGACGLHGTLTLDLGRSPVAEISAIGPARLPYRDFLVALGLRAGTRTKQIHLYGGVSWNRGGVLRARISGGGATCTDSVAANGDFASLAIARHKLVAQLGSFGGGGYEFRTRCPGPLGPQGSLADGGAQWPPRDTAKLVIPLGGDASFTDDGYHGQTDADLTLTMTHPRLVRHPGINVVTIAN
jgi:hypothetical protein